MADRRVTSDSRGDSRGSAGAKRFIAKPAVCPFCVGKAKIDYKDVSTLAQYTSGHGKIASRRRSRACAKHQRSLAHAIKRARFLALLPYAPGHVWRTGGGDSRQAVS